MRRPACTAAVGVILLALLLPTLPAAAQYFGRNKVQYDTFDFQVLRTEHFEIYYYPEEEQAVRDAARMAERWYRRHARTFLREFDEPKPLIFYANDADFHQTNVIQGMLGQGTGGVTEGLKQRVVMPLTGSYAETDHVLGHELVHSFQYDIGLNRKDSTRFALNALPLWMMEGMAEYLSVGREDAHTAMWLRDALARDDLPTLEQLTKDYRYFPYRYGQAYLAYIGGKYGDAAVADLYKLSGRAGVDTAMVYTLGIQADSLSKEWIQVIRDTYGPLMADREPAEAAGRRVLAADLDAGEMNLSPTVSPDGKYVAFLSERDIFNINLFIADAETGEVLKRLKSGNANPHFDAIRFINSAGSWSPDGKQLVFVTFAQGDNELTLFDVDAREIARRITIDGVTAITNPAWSPDGGSIVFTGLDGGISDLYQIDLATNAVRQLTNDRYADFQPAWAPDGRSVAFVTDRGAGGTTFEDLDYGRYRIGVLDVETGAIRVVAPFERALHHNPQFSPDGRSLYFISDQDGFKDIYRYALETDDVFRVTRLKTGVSGITATSPAMSVAAQSGRMMFSVFGDGAYTVYARELDETEGEPVTPSTGVIATASLLPPVRSANQGLVGSYLDDPATGLPTEEDVSAASAYSPRLELDFVAPPTVGVAAGGMYGTRVGGGVGFFFSDMLGNQNLSIAAQANGTYKDVGAQATYLNLGNRFNYGATAGHIPILFGYAGGGIDPQSRAYVVEQLRMRIFIDQASLLAQYPLTTTRRFELSGGFVRYGFDYEIEQYIMFGGVVNRRRLSAEDGSSLVFPQMTEPEAIYFFQTSAAYVGDYSNFGFTSPVQGGRYRFEVSPQVGSSTYLTALADYRKYLFANPVTFAVRGLHIGNYGANRDDLFTAQYLSYSYYPGFVRGYSINSFDPDECGGNTAGACPALDRLSGTHVALASAEVRLPLFGTDTYGLLNFSYLPTELSLFADAAVAWYDDEKPTLAFSRDAADTRRIPVTSVGASMRFNVLGYMVLEAFYAYPFQRPDKGAHLGFQLSPGW